MPCQAMTSRVERGRLTRNQPVAVATRLLAERGARTPSIEEVLHRAGVQPAARRFMDEELPMSAAEQGGRPPLSFAGGAGRA
jgi:hypothetical protein